MRAVEVEEIGENDDVVSWSASLRVVRQKTPRGQHKRRTMKEHSSAVRKRASILVGRNSQQGSSVLAPFIAYAFHAAFPVKRGPVPLHVLRKVSQYDLIRVVCDDYVRGGQREAGHQQGRERTAGAKFDHLSSGDWWASEKPRRGKEWEISVIYLSARRPG